MKDDLLDNLQPDSDSVNTPFYKKKIFYIGIGILLLIIVIIIIIIIVFSSSSTKTHDFSSSFIESKEIIINPDQGFYEHIKIIITPDSFPNNTINPPQLYHLRCDISQFSGKVNSDKIDKKLTETVLKGLDDYLYKIKSKNKNAIIRFCYSPEFGEEADKEPSLSMIIEHIKQLSSILNNHIDTLTAIEAGMLGPWGEMHTSEIATEENKALVIKHWLENTNEIPILTRTPLNIFTYFNKTLDEMEKFEIKKGTLGYRLGLFNDCVFSNDTDYGTYENRTRETNWLSTQNDHLPYGGEVCSVHKMNDLENCLPEMKLLSLSYLNYNYNQDIIIDKWGNLFYNSNLGNDSLFYNVSGLHYIYSHMGYRLVMRSIHVKYKEGGKFEANIKIENVGFGNLFKKKKVDIIYTDLNGTIIQRSEAGNYSGENILKINGNLLKKENEDYKVFIRIYGSFDNNIVYYPIQFANEKIYDNNIKANFIFLVKKGGEIIDYKQYL